jgi:uncharacterized protein YfbU (UPF0304 family)
LDAVNADRKKSGIDSVTEEGFEIIMDRLEKEWFALVGSSNAFLYEISELYPDQAYSQSRLCHAIGGLNMCHLR